MAVKDLSLHDEILFMSLFKNIVKYSILNYSKYSNIVLVSLESEQDYAFSENSLDFFIWAFSLRGVGVQ